MIYLRGERVKYVGEDNPRDCLVIKGQVLRVSPSHNESDESGVCVTALRFEFGQMVTEVLYLPQGDVEKLKEESK